MPFSLPRGLRDLEPDQYMLIERLRSTFYDVCGIFGFKIMEPSPIELLSTLEVKSGPAIRDEIYFFKDKGGREVGLRFDLTVGLTRYVCSKRGLQLPLKVAAFSDMWRYDEPQYGRFRWFYQWDAEIFGSSSPHADAEIMEFTSILYERLGLEEILLQIGDRSIVEEYIRKKVGVKNEQLTVSLLRALDKVGKKPVSGIVREYSEKGVKREHLDRLIELGKLRGEPEKVLAGLREMGLEGFNSLTKLVDALRDRSVKNVKLDMGIVRGLDYYSGIVFEAYDKNDEALGALCGGGRYDTLPAAFGRGEIRATGVAGGVERTVIALSRRVPKTERPEVEVFVAYATRELMGNASSIASSLRRKGIRAELDILGRSLKSQIELASSRGIPYVAIAAPKEYSRGQLILRNMREGSQSLVSLGELAERVSH